MLGHDEVPAIFEAILPRKFIWEDGIAVQNRYFLAFALCVVFYVPAFKAGVWFMRDRERWDLRWYMLAHNALMCVFSTLGAAVSMWIWVESIRESGSLSASVCSGFFYRTRAGFWCFLFSSSKIFELTETVVQVLEKKSIILLHWFHHYVTFVYCLVGSYYTHEVPSAIWFCWMNFFVHAVMYAYFFMATLTGKSLWWGKYVTHIQIIQMIIGCWVTYISYGCTRAFRPLVYAATAMYGVYLLLFIKLYIEKYLGGGGRGKGRGKDKGAGSAKDEPKDE
eukprot:c6695_g1_i1.p1 GENE.c6695_g1_i1~~c6695_g1_i1.p1  ORF type:complete len:279 (+),score=38.69 c6695_g1_i1:88-924(+)